MTQHYRNKPSNETRATSAHSKPELTPKDYSDAMQSQNACNLTALIKALSRVLPAIHAESDGSDDVNNHPIVKLYVEQFAHLSNGRDYSSAYNICSIKAKRAA